MLLSKAWQGVHFDIAICWPISNVLPSFHQNQGFQHHLNTLLKRHKVWKWERIPFQNMSFLRDFKENFSVIWDSSWKKFTRGRGEWILAFDGNNPQNPDPLPTFEKNVGHLGNGDWSFNTSMKHLLHITRTNTISRTHSQSSQKHPLAEFFQQARVLILYQIILWILTTRLLLNVEG